MMAAELFKGYAEVDHSVNVTGIAQDSRLVKQGDVFLAVQGLTRHGLEFANQVEQQGAAALAWEPPFTGGIHTRLPLIKVEHLSRVCGEVASRFYAYPSQAMKVIGVTGTDGKTSVSHFLAQAFNQSDAPAGLMGTLGSGLLNQLKYSGYTTPDAVQLQAHMRELKEQGAKAVCMEVSSHALDQHRVAGVQFDVAVFTNLSRDHLDYHGSMDAYANAKKRLFEWEGLSTVVINADDAIARQWLSDWSDKNVWTYSLNEKNKVGQTVVAKSIKMHEQGISVQVDTPKDSAQLDLSLMGRFNVSNALAVLTTLLASGVDLSDAVARVNALEPVEGRMQLISGETQVVVDFAHTPAALESVLDSLREQVSGSLLCVMGCGGDRDKGKRPLMGGIASDKADHVWITDDNPRSEDPDQIIQDIVSGVANKKSCTVMRPREQAIRAAINAAGKNDVVLLAGKGHESWQEIQGVKHEFSDAAWAKRILRELAS